MDVKERRSLILKCYKEGLTPKETASTCGVTVSCIYTFAKRYHITFAKKQHFKPADPEFIEFCKTHNRDEIFEVYGNKGLRLIYRDNLEHKIKQRDISDFKKSIIKDLESGEKQASVAKKYNVTRQYINQIYTKCIKK